MNICAVWRIYTVCLVCVYSHVSVCVCWCWFTAFFRVCARLIFSFLSPTNHKCAVSGLFRSSWNTNLHCTALPFPGSTKYYWKRIVLSPPPDKKVQHADWPCVWCYCSNPYVCIQFVAFITLLFYSVLSLESESGACVFDDPKIAWVNKDCC